MFVVATKCCRRWFESGDPEGFAMIDVVLAALVKVVIAPDENVLVSLGLRAERALLDFTFLVGGPLRVLLPFSDAFERVLRTGIQSVISSEPTTGQSSLASSVGGVNRFKSQNCSWKVEVVRVTSCVFVFGTPLIGRSKVL